MVRERELEQFSAGGMHAWLYGACASPPSRHTIITGKSMVWNNRAVWSLVYGDRLTPFYPLFETGHLHGLLSCSVAPVWNLRQYIRRLRNLQSGDLKFGQTISTQFDVLGVDVNGVQAQGPKHFGGKLAYGLIEQPGKWGSRRWGARWSLLYKYKAIVKPSIYWILQVDCIHLHSLPLHSSLDRIHLHSFPLHSSLSSQLHSDGRWIRFG